MAVCPGMALILLSILLISIPAQSLKRDLADIRYRFTSCGMTGRSGPTHETCIDYYNSINSRLSQGFLLPAVGMDYEYAQRFDVPRFGLYNITAAGASGGSGVCNMEVGHGIARKVQVELYPKLELLVIVGQRGLSFCDLEPNSLPCIDQSSSTSTCSDRWCSYIQDSFENESRIDVFGGGGGGGASMVRASSVQGVDPDPIVIGAGGGGASALLGYEVENSSMQSALSYRNHINASSGFIGINDGNLGTRYSDAYNTAGAGGGYHKNNAITKLDIDGGYLGNVEEFAIGGIHCANVLHGVLVNGTDGGFGGGGGGCAGGGGGGGYTGGSILGVGKFVPGGGGISYTGSAFETSFKVINFLTDISNIQLDGYVDIVHADCECIFKCEVYNTEDMFECICPGDTLLAPDGSDCYTETSVSVTEGPALTLPPGDTGIIFNYQQFTFNNRIFLYSVDFMVTVKQNLMEIGEEEESIHELCIIGFLGENNKLVAQTDVHRRSLQRLNTIARVNMDGVVEDQFSFLDIPVAVYSGLIVSAGNCSVENINMNISIRDRQIDEFVEVDGAVPSEVANELFHDITTELKPVTSRSRSIDDNIKLGVGIVAALTMAIIIGVAGSVFVFIYCQKYQKRHGYLNASTTTTELVVSSNIEETPILLEKDDRNKNVSTCRSDYILVHNDN